MLSLLHCEYIKLKRSKFLLIGILGTLIVPFLVIVKAVTNYLSDPEAVIKLTIPSFIFFFLKMLFGGILLCATQTPFIYLTIRTKGFVMPLIAIAVISLINVVLSNSGVAGFYPWSATYLLVIGRSSGQNCPKEISIGIILIMCLLAIIASIYRFKKEEVK